MKDKQLTKEIKEFFEEKGIEYKEEKFIMWYGFAELQMKQDTYWSPCENCDNPSCRKKDDFPIWFCEDQR